MKIKDLCESERPREKLLSMGAETLSNGELLAVLLRSGTADMSAVDLARTLLSRAGGKLGKLMTMSPGRMCEGVKGMGPAKAAVIAAARELGKRFIEENTTDGELSFTTPRQVFDLMLPVLKDLDHEECWAVLLNDSNYLIDRIRLTSGGIRSTLIDPRQILRMALEKNAGAVILVHNHPSGNPKPSAADVKSTDSLRLACSACSIALLDHVVISNDCFYSMADDCRYDK